MDFAVPLAEDFAARAYLAADHLFTTLRCRAPANKDRFVAQSMNEISFEAAGL